MITQKDIRLDLHQPHCLGWHLPKTSRVLGRRWQRSSKWLWIESDRFQNQRSQRTVFSIYRTCHRPQVKGRLPKWSNWYDPKMFNEILTPCFPGWLAFQAWPFGFSFAHGDAMGRPHAEVPGIAATSRAITCGGKSSDVKANQRCRGGNRCTCSNSWQPAQELYGIAMLHLYLDLLYNEDTLHLGTAWLFFVGVASGLPENL